MAITTAKGTQFLLGTGASPFTFAAIGQVRSITGMTVKSKIIDVTTHDTPGFWRRAIGVLMELVTFSFDINYNSTDATHAFATGLWNQMVNLLKSGLKEIFPNGAGTLIGDGYISSHDFAAAIDNVLIAKIAGTMTDAITASNP